MHPQATRTPHDELAVIARSIDAETHLVTSLVQTHGAFLDQPSLVSNLLELHTTRRFRGYDIDYRRLTVLEEIEAYFGGDRCQWHVGAENSKGINNQYLVLAIRSADGAKEHAVAISPLAGLHATYVVRDDTSDAQWPIILAQSKSEARESGAHRLLFVDDGNNQYDSMRDRMIQLIEHPAIVQ